MQENEQGSLKLNSLEYLISALTLPEYGDAPEWVKQVCQEARDMYKEEMASMYKAGMLTEVKNQLLRK